MTTIKSADLFYAYSRIIHNNWILKSQAFSLTTSCSILIECQIRHQIVTLIEYYYILKFRVSLYTIKNNDDY